MTATRGGVFSLSQQVDLLSILALHIGIQVSRSLYCQLVSEEVLKYFVYFATVGVYFSICIGLNILSIYIYIYIGMNASICAMR